jgi:hypothetical protein
MSATKEDRDGRAVNPKLAPIRHVCDRLYAGVFEQVKAKAITASARGRIDYVFPHPRPGTTRTAEARS